MLNMDTISISEIVGEQEVIKSSFESHEELTEGRKESLQFSAPTRKAIPEHLKFFHEPENINQFITDLHDNMYQYVFSRVRDASFTQEIINNFVVYMLSEAPSRNNVPRFTLYDPVRYKNQPYYKWFIFQLKFFYYDYRKQAYKLSLQISLSESGYEETVETSANNAMNIDMLSREDASNDVMSLHYVEELDNYLMSLSDTHKDTFCFEAHAYEIFNAKIRGETNKEIASRYSISNSAVSQWLTKLKSVITDFSEGELAPITA